MILSVKKKTLLFSKKFGFNLGIVQWVERYIWDVEVARSSRAIQTIMWIN